jgi:tol-pal system protein YbgF
MRGAPERAAGTPAVRARAGWAPVRARARGLSAVPAPALLLAALLVPGCYAPQLALMRSGLDSLRTVVDTLTIRDSVGYQVLVDTRRQVVEQRDILLSTRATAGSTTQEMFEQMERLNTRLDEVLNRFNQVSQRIAPPTTASPTAPDPNQLYDQASQDLTQGRYGLALQGFREFVRRFPESELADNAQYGVGECFFAQSQFDSAASEYAMVEARFPGGDKMPAGLWKMALTQEKLGEAAASRKTLQDLVKRYPQSGEAQLARERLGPARRR